MIPLGELAARATARAQRLRLLRMVAAEFGLTAADIVDADLPAVIYDQERYPTAAMRAPSGFPEIRPAPIGGVARSR